MKKQKNNICVLNLLLFISSFVLLSFNGFSGNSDNSVDHLHLSVSTSHHAVNDNLLQLSEENETENDESFELLAITIPAFIKQIQLELVYTTVSFLQSNFLNKAAPVYLRVCNFRI